MRVADFFCGAGGFSEGFRQAGFDICFAVDKWQPAVNTYMANKPNCRVILDDVIRISKLPDDEFHKLVPDTEVIIGSPPCVAFSNSNKSGKGDKTHGVELVKAYLRIVARKKYKADSKLKYWVLENVPNIRKYLKDQYSATELDLQGDFSLAVIGESTGIYNAKYYGAPTNRKRFLCGEFPYVEKIRDDDSVTNLGTVLSSLGSPLICTHEMIEDCNYPGFEMARDEVTDHQYLQVLQEFEWKTAKRLKEDKGYMGRMSFPENINKPARTVMANMSSSSRESMIISTDAGTFRLPTVREAASMMSFPIDYRFYGASKGIKHTLVGNAVPPKMSYAVAKAIAYDAGIEVPKDYIPICHDFSIPFNNLNFTVQEEKAEKPKRDVSKFKYHIPYMIVNAYRVELTNYHSDFTKKSFTWTAEIHYSQGKDKARIYTPSNIEDCLSNEIIAASNRFIDCLKPRLCSYESFQKNFCMTEKQRIEKNILGPYELLELIKEHTLSTISEMNMSGSIKTQGEVRLIPVPILIGFYTLERILKIMGGNK